VPGTLPGYLGVAAFAGIKVRIFVWAFVLFLFTRKSPIPRSKFWLYSLVGAIVSSLLDLPGYALALAAPGKIVFC
jgi:hypothetical protein